MTRKRIITPAFVIDNMDILRKTRTEKAISQQELGYISGVSMEMIRQYENLTCLPKKENYNKSAEFFGWKLWL